MRFSHGTRALVLAAALAMGATTASAEMVLHRGNSGDPETLDPQKTSSVYEGNILRDLFEGLVIHSAAAKILPGVADSWTSSADGLTWTFKLKSNAKWSNGEPVTADDFVYSYRRMMDAATGSQYANMLFVIKNAEALNKGTGKPEDLGVEAVDAHTLKFTLSGPTPYFIELLAHQSSFPVYRGAIEKYGKDWIKPENFVSNGPFKLTENVPHDHITIIRNPAHYDAAKVKLDKVVYLPTEDRSAALRRFQAGELDMNDEVPTDQIKFIRQNMKDEFRPAPYLGTYYFVFNTKKPPFDDVRVRRALSLMVDREFLAEEIWGGTMLPGYSMVPEGTGSYGTPVWWSAKDKSPADREDEAMRLMKEAGFGPGGKTLKLEIRYNTSENHKKTSVALADMWKPLNVEVSLVNTDVKTHYAFLREHQPFDVARAGWIADYNDAQNFLFLAETATKSLNYSQYSNPEYDALMARAATEGDAAKRSATLHEAETILMRDEPYLVLMTYMSKQMVSKRLKGWEPNTLDYHPSRYLWLE
ncbi:MAG: peptide ABC transporter substrate-binding protein [Hyphomicrobiales bacterium]|nr:peptide ABC transporter substrate-binding protein [Hyphomicrobiales bacterium]